MSRTVIEESYHSGPTSAAEYNFCEGLGTSGEADDVPLSECNAARQGNPSVAVCQRADCFMGR